MYSRSYKDSAVPLPEGYGGTAFGEPWEAEESSAAAREAEGEDSREAVSVGAHGGPSERTEHGGLLGGIFGATGLHMPKIGTEEILILAAAAFLFFSDGGDKECAIMLLLLLFV